VSVNKFADMRLSPLHRTRDNKRENAALFFTRPTEMQSINVNAGFSRAKLKKKEGKPNSPCLVKTLETIGLFL
jgi:hypothetical protein